MHRLEFKCVQANAFPCRAANRPCTIVFPLENFRNWGPTRAPTALRLTTNVSKNTKEAREAAPTLWNATPPWSFYTKTYRRSRPARIRVTCPTGAHRHRPHGPSAHRDHRPRPRRTGSCQERQNKFKPRTTNGRSNYVKQPARQSIH